MENSISGVHGNIGEIGTVYPRSGGHEGELDTYSSLSGVI